MRWLAALLLLASPAFAASFDHFTGTAAPSGWTFVTAANGVACMNGTIVAGSGGTCPGAVSGESFFSQVTSANADVVIGYRTTPVSMTTSKRFWFTVRGNQAVNSFIYLTEGVPVEGTNVGLFGGATGKVLARVNVGQNAGINVGVRRYDAATRAVTEWDTATSTWGAATKNLTTTLAATYQTVMFEVDGTGRRWRVGVVGQALATPANTPQSGMALIALTDWVLFSFHEGGAIYCNPTCGTLYLAVGEPTNDVAIAIQQNIESYAEDDGTAIYGWTNGRNAGGTWNIYRQTALPDVNGLPARAVPDDRTTTVLAVGGAAAWDEQHVKDPWVLRDGATYYMCYSGARVSDGKFQAGCATASSVDGPWTKSPGNPLLPLSAATTQDQTLNPVIVKDELEPNAAKRWKLIYVGADNGAPIKFRAFVRTCSAPPDNAACDTAAEWSAATQIADVGGGGSIDENGWGRIVPEVNSGLVYLFGGVKDNTAPPRRQETYQTHSDRWLTAGTKSGVVTNADLSSNCNTTTTAIVNTPGSRSLTVASTTGCTADMPVVLDDDATTGNYRWNRILNVVNGTTLTLYHTEDSFASGGRVRQPNAFNQIDVGDKAIYAGGYYTLATCFDPMQGGGSALDAYSEVSCMWTASAITGPWTLYNLGSPVSPLANTLFNRGASNENMSLLNTPFRASPGSGSPSANGASLPEFRPITFPK